ncbi:MAG: ribonuclease P protein component [Ignavibacteriales bacterium]
MPDSFTHIKRSKEYGRVYQTGKKFVGRFMVIYLVKNGLQINRYGIVASKKVGNAVVRNRAKRRLREVVKGLDMHLGKGYDVIFLARFGVQNAIFGDIVAESQKLMRKAGLNQ